MRYRQINENLLVRPVPEEESTIVVERDPRSLIRATIEEFGREVMGKVKRGHIVHIDPKYAREFPVDKETWYIVTYNNLLAIEEE